MFDNTSGERMVVNWRGPLLTAAIFAATFAILLLMAHQNQSNTSDMGSSLREDPYGTSLLFDSYTRAGYQVKRSQDADSLSDQDALKTTAFFIGGHTLEDWRMENGKVHIGEKFRVRLADFLTRGGRVVLVAPTWKIESESQGWDVEIKWYQTPHESAPTWIPAGPSVVPEGIEKMYLGGDAPWLQTDVAWTPLYSAKAGSDVHVYMAMRRVGNGELIAASQESFLLNETIKMHQNPVLLDFLAGGRAVVWVDETLHGLHQDQGVLWLVHRYQLQVALLLFWATLLALLWSISGDLVRRPSHNSEEEIVRHSEAAGVAARRLLQRSIGTEQVLAECWEEFRRRSPQDAQAIAANPHTGPRLREALGQPPLVGYRQLSQLIAERRAPAKGMLRANRPAPVSSRPLPKNHPEEVRIT
jgi:hypothetical protein